MEYDYRTELAEQFAELAEILNRQMHTVRLDEWEELDMTIPQIRTLVLLRRMGPLRMGNISVLLGRALSATTTVVDRLVDKELVDRVSDPNDRRVVICELTESGQQAVERFWRVGSERLDLVLKELDVAQLETVVSAFQILRSISEKIEAEFQSLGGPG